MSEKRLWQGIEVMFDEGVFRYVARHVPRHVKSAGGELEMVSFELTAVEIRFVVQEANRGDAGVGSLTLKCVCR